MKKELMLNEVDDIRNIIDNQKIVFFSWSRNLF